jgi:hypothetical protein
MKQPGVRKLVLSKSATVDASIDAVQMDNELMLL